MQYGICDDFKLLYIWFWSGYYTVPKNRKHNDEKEKRNPVGVANYTRTIHVWLNEGPSVLVLFRMYHIRQNALLPRMPICHTWMILYIGFCTLLCTLASIAMLTRHTAHTRKVALSVSALVFKWLVMVKIDQW